MHPEAVARRSAIAAAVRVFVMGVLAIGHPCRYGAAAATGRQHTRPAPHGLGPRRVLLDDSASAANQNQTAQDLMHLVALLSHRVAARWEMPDNVVGTLTGLSDPLARGRWGEACELLEVAQEAARLWVLAEAGWLPAPLPDCWSHLPPDAKQWLEHHAHTATHTDSSTED